MSSIPDRLFKISKSYLDQVRDRIDAELTERERAVAEQELRGRGEDTSLPSFAASNGKNGGGNGDSEFRTADDMMRRAEERIAAARRERQSRDQINQNGETSSSTATATVVPPPSVPTPSASDLKSDDPDAPDYRVLGVPVGSDLATVLGAYEKLARRCDPRRFPEDSIEQKEAARILTRINASYENLRKRLDPTENRFGKLELE